MPFRRKFGGRRRRFGGRRSFRRLHRKAPRRTFKRKARGPSRQVVKRPTFFADNCFVKLKYHFRSNMQTAGSNNIVYDYALNDIWDPDFSVGGKTAYGQEVWANFYQYFTVNASKIKIQFIGVGLSNPSAQALDVVLWPTASVTYGSDNDFNCVIPYAQQKIMNLVGGKNKAESEMRAFMSTAKITGVAKERVRTDPNFSGKLSTISTGGSSPNNLTAWRISVQSADRGDTVSYVLNGTITYYCKLYTRKTPTWNIASANDTNWASHAFGDGPTGGYTGPYGATGGTYTFGPGK